MESSDSGRAGPTMDATTKANAFREVLRRMAASEKVSPELWHQFVAAQNDDLKTGPEIGEKVPAFNLPDQKGKQLSLQQLLGAQGVATGLCSQRRLVTLLPFAARRAAKVRAGSQG